MPNRYFLDIAGAEDVFCEVDEILVQIDNLVGDEVPKLFALVGDFLPGIEANLRFLIGSFLEKDKISGLPMRTSEERKEKKYRERYPHRSKETKTGSCLPV